MSHWFLISWYRPKNFCIAENHQKQLYNEEVMRKLFQHANLYLKKYYFSYCEGDGPLHITRPNVGGTTPPPQKIVVDMRPPHPPPRYPHRFLTGIFEAKLQSW